MESIRHRRSRFPIIIFALLFVGLLASFGALLSTQAYIQAPRPLSIGMLADLLLTAPIAYWIIAKRLRMSTIPFALVGLIGVAFAKLLFPISQQPLVNLACCVYLPVLTLIIAERIRVACRTQLTEELRLTNKGNQGYDAPQRIRRLVSSCLGDGWSTRRISTELTMFYYLLRLPQAGNRKRDRVEVPSGATPFFYHQKSGLAVLLFGFLLAVTVELTALHLLVAMWSHALAWFATLTSLYTMLAIVAQMRAISSRPIFIHDGKLHLRNGMFALAEIPLESITRCDPTQHAPQRVNDQCDEKPLILPATFPAAHNLVLYLDQTYQAELPYGHKKAFQVVTLAVDDRTALIEALNENHCPD